MLQVTVLLALGFAIVIAIFAVQNTTPVAVSFLMFRAQDVAVSVLVLIAAALGAVLMLLIGAAREVRLRLHSRGLSQQLKGAQQRVRELEAQTTSPASTALAPSPPPTEPPAAP